MIKNIKIRLKVKYISKHNKYKVIIKVGKFKKKFIYTMPILGDNI